MRKVLRLMKEKEGMEMEEEPEILPREAVTLDERAELALRQFRLWSSRPGCRYLKYAVALCAAPQDDAGIEGLYERLAEQFGAEPRQIERAIRYAVQACWLEGAGDYCEKLWGMPADSIPTNAQLIKLLTGYLSREEEG